MQQLCKLYAIDIILCFSFEIQSKFSLEQEKIRYFNIPWLIPSYQQSEIEDKFKFYQWLQANNFANLLPKQKAINDYPNIIKNGNGYSAAYVNLILDSKDLVKINFDQNSRPYICQEYIPGMEEYAHHFIAINGVPIKQKTYKHIFNNLEHNQQYYIKGRGLFNKEIAKIELAEEYIEVLNSIIKNVQFTGIGCIDFKIYNQQIYLFEFNSRMGGSLIYFDHVMRDFDDFISTVKALLSSQTL